MSGLYSRKTGCWRLLCLAVVSVVAFEAATASAQPTPLTEPEPASAAAARPWSDASPDASAGQPVMIHVIVALCSKAYLHCGGGAKGDPADLESNLYWGALFGARRMFEGRHSPWTRVSSTTSAGPVLEHIVYKRSGGPFGEAYVSLEAWSGNDTDDAIERFWNLATGGGQVTFQGRSERIHAVGYAGYNRLMDDVELPAPASGQAIPSFVLAKSSERTFGRKLRQAGSFPLITTKGSMAPEGYTIMAAARALADNYSARAIRVRMVEDYKRHQKIPEREASFTFAWPHP